MQTKIFCFEKLITISITSDKHIFDKLQLTFPNVEWSDNANCDFVITYKQIRNISEKYKQTYNKQKINPFRNSSYYICQKNKLFIAYSPKQKYSSENIILKQENKIEILSTKQNDYKILVRIINELIIRELLHNNFFPIHSSCIVQDGKANLFFGRKGSGKSVALFCMVLLDKAFPLSNDITFVGKTNNIWKAYGISYDLTFDTFFLKQLEKYKVFIDTNNKIKKYSSNKLRFTPKKFCDVLNTCWVWSAPIENINFVNLNIDNKFSRKKMNQKLSEDVLIKYGRDDNFVFEDLLLINDDIPNYEIKKLVTDIDFYHLTGNILKYYENNRMYERNDD